MNGNKLDGDFRQGVLERLHDGIYEDGEPFGLNGGRRGRRNRKLRTTFVELSFEQLGHCLWMLSALSVVLDDGAELS